MTPEEAAAVLNGREYRDEIPSAEFAAELRQNGLVAVFGASDDLVEFRGAISDELGAYSGTTALIDERGMLRNRDEIDDDDELADYFARKPLAVPISALWCEEGSAFAWTYKTDIPHETFDILEDGEPYCRGIVFALGSIRAASADTHPKDGDVQQAPLVSGAVPKADAHD